MLSATSILSAAVLTMKESSQLYFAPEWALRLVVRQVKLRWLLRSSVSFWSVSSNRLPGIVGVGRSSRLLGAPSLAYTYK
jgi:hypothetical protein